jgi:VWFA-related protein
LERSANKEGVMAVKKYLVAWLTVAALLVPATAQQSGQSQVPDAPSAVRKPETPPPAPAPPPKPAPQSNSDSTNPADQPVITPRNASAQPQPTGRDELAYKITTNVNYVVLPVLVKDINGSLVQGLSRSDFKIRENDVPQRIDMFSNDPFPISAAVVIDTGIPGVVLDKVKASLPSMLAAFAGFDEVSIFTFDNTWRQEHNFSAVTGTQMDATLEHIRQEKGEEGGVPFAGGPFNSPPMINGQPVVPGSAPPAGAQVARTPSHILNDAILAAAQSLVARDRTRRRIIFVISDGREKGSKTSFSDVVKVLLSHNIAVYGIGVGASAEPGYSTAQRIHIPGFGEGNILPKYASNTGGESFNELSQRAIESAYSRVTEEARNQYTIGYAAQNPLATGYRRIEVIVSRPDCSTVKTSNCVYVYSKDGYWPLPPSRQ